MSIVDVHCHLLPGIDDGSSDVEMSVRMLRMEAEQGVDVVVATPHFYADRSNLRSFLRNRSEAIARIRELELTDVPAVVCGAEVAYFYGMGTAAGIGDALCVEGTNTMLLEMPFSAWRPQVVHDVEKLCGQGVVPVLAHIERFLPMQKDRALVQELMQLPVYVQVNAGCLLRWRSRRSGIRLFQKGTAHVLGSDAHNITSRCPNLQAGRDVLRQKLGESVLDKMDEMSEILFVR